MQTQITISDQMRTRNPKGMEYLSAISIATLNETRKSILLMLAYKSNLVFGIVSIILSFLGISYVISDGKPTPFRIASSLVGYLIWYYVMLITANMGESLLSESSSGTLEQMFISPVPIGFILIGRILGNLVVSSIQLVTVGVILISGFNLPIRWSLDAIPVAFITVLGLFGFGFMLGGIALIFKQISSITAIVNYVLVFLNGALVPIEQFPSWLLLIARILPSTLGITVMRNILLNGMTLRDVWSNGSLPLLTIHSAVYLISGWIILNWCIGVAKKQGTLGQY
jgi:ABC-2 type transport system permease protein